MRYLYFLFFLLVSTILLASTPKIINWSNLPLKKSIKERLKKNELYSDAEVDDFKKGKFAMQSMETKLAGLHPKRCSFALRKIALYENYQEYMGFVDKSTYNDKTKLLVFNISTSLLPFKFGLRMKLDRMHKVGIYPFVFETGFLKGLVGRIHVSEYKSRCLFYVESNWKGPETQLSSTILGFASKSLLKLGLEHIFRISKTY